MSEADALKLVKKAKSLKTTSITRWKPDWDGAAMEYEKGAQIYAHLGLVAEAKDAWTSSSEAHAQAGNLFLAGKNMDNLAQLLKDKKDVNGSAAAYAAAAKYYIDDNKPDRQAEALQRAARTVMADNATQAAKYLDDGIRALETSGKHHLTGDLFPLLLQCYLKANMIPESVATIKRQFVSFKAMDNQKGIARGVLEIIVIALGTGDEILARRYFEESEQEFPEFMRNEEWALSADLIAAMERRDETRLKDILKDSTFTFLNVEISRRAKKLKIGSGPASGPASPSNDADAAPEDDER